MERGSEKKDREKGTQAEAAYRRGLEMACRRQCGSDGLEHFLQAYGLEPDNPLYAADLALSLHDAERASEAWQVAARMAARLSPEHVERFDDTESFRVGLVFERVLAEPQRSLAFLARACALAPECLERRLYHAATLAECGYRDEAFALAGAVVNALDRVAEPTPEEAHQLARAAHLLCLSDPVRAHEAARRALGAAPDHPGVLREAGIVALENNDAQEALGHFREATRLAPDVGIYWGGLQCSLLRLGMFEEAFLLGQDLLKRWPDDATLRFNTAVAALDRGWYKEAEQGLVELIGRSPDDALAHGALGICCAVGGRVAEAREEQRLALELDGDNPEVQKLSAEIDRLLDDGDRPAPEVLGSLLMAALGAVLGRPKHGKGR